VSVSEITTLDGRRQQIFQKGREAFGIECDRRSVPGSVTQRACGFCGSRVVLYPICDALHLVHGPGGCAAYTWDIRGALSSGPELHRLSFCTDMREMDIISGGEKKLASALRSLIDRYSPKAAFVYRSCIAGIIGDDVDAVCAKVAAEKKIPVIPVMSEGFKGTKKSGYQAACEALSKLVGTVKAPRKPKSVNILGDFNLAGETWAVKKLFEECGVTVNATLTGDGRVDDIRAAHAASLNIVQCAGSMTHLAKIMLERHGIPFIHVSFFGVEDMAQALYDTVSFFDDKLMLERARALVVRETLKIAEETRAIAARVAGARAAVYTGGAFKVFSLVRSLRTLGVKTVLAGSQTGSREDYEALSRLCDDGTVIIDDANPMELAKFILEKDVDLLIGGVKERPVAFKLGVAFCDHNHERKTPLAGFDGALNFAREAALSLTSPVWRLCKRRRAIKEEFQL
jgi:nitrogenase molybdenum-cofactor synthesis protein NifE